MLRVLRAQQGQPALMEQVELREPLGLVLRALRVQQALVLRDQLEQLVLVLTVQREPLELLELVALPELRAQE